MRCEPCQGTGHVLDYAIPWKMAMHSKPATKPCDACGGTGQQHCCDGLRAQPDDDWTHAVCK